MTIRHVLLDADGVIQHLPGGWLAAMEPYLGERSGEFFQRAWSEELPMLVGGGDYLPLLAATLQEYGVMEPVEAVYAAVWHRIDVIEESIALVHRLRAAGYGVHLGTNQERHRAAYMRTTLGYDDLFDVCCYSCELGVAKPEPAFFAKAAVLIGAEPGEVLFVDDHEPNILGAREAGMSAVQWHFDAGREVLETALTSHGLAL